MQMGSRHIDRVDEGYTMCLYLVNVVAPCALGWVGLLCSHSVGSSFCSDSILPSCHGGIMGRHDLIIVWMVVMASILYGW